jgi:HPt (histidine-containing phosphotransfer) domain-containing protein
MGSVLREEFSAAEAIADPRVLDLIHLRSYTMNNVVLERELLGLFLGQLPSLLTQLSPDAEPEDWKFALHTLKGSARAIGAEAIAEIVETMETLVCDDGRAALVGRLAAAAACFEQEARKLLD